MSAKKKTSWFKVLLTIVVVLAVLVLVAEFALERVAKTAFNAAAPSFLGVQKASVEKIDLSLFRSPTFTLEGLVIGNPEGFQTPSLFELESVKVDLENKSLFTDTIVIPSIEIRGTDLTYEQRLKSNISALLDHFESAEKEEKEEQSDDSAPAKKVVIRDLKVNDTVLHLAVIGTGSHSAPIPLPPLHLAGIGEPKSESDEAGTSFAAAVTEILKAILSSVTSVLGNVAGLATDAAKATASAFVDGASAVGSAVADGATTAASAVADGTTAAVSAVADGATAAASAVADGATAAASAIADGAKALTSFLPFGGGDSSDDAPAPAE